VLPLPVAGEALPEELKMDIYRPADQDDELAARPVVLVFHTGNFLPNVTNGGITGTRTDSSVVEICTRLAQHGYVAASCTYRSGWNPLAASQPLRALGLIQAAYRGVQDGSTAIRYFKHTVANLDNPYGVDTTRITAFGVGTGGYLTLGLGHLDRYNEILTTTNGPGKFVFDPGTGTPVPMVVQAYHGDIEGKVTTIAPDGAFGYPAGDTTTYSNWPAHTSDFQLCVNVGGALGDISWLEEISVPTISIQSAFDIFAPYDDATLIVPTTGDNIVRVQGSLQIARKQEQLGTNQPWKDAMIDDEWTRAAQAAAARAGHEYIEGLMPIARDANSIGRDEGTAIDWWDPNAATPANSPCMGLPWNVCPHPAGTMEMPLTFHTQGLLLNEGMSAEKARTNIDSIMGYFYPRAYITLDLAALVSSTDEVISANEVQLTLAPNPASADVILSSAEVSPMREVQLFDLNGRLLRSYSNIDNNYYYINRGDLPSGTYIVRVAFDEGIASKKLMLK
jgi:hypothetical protein